MVRAEREWYLLRDSPLGRKDHLHASRHHQNGDGLDNRRQNLRVCTHAENGANRQRLNRNNTTGVNGVYRHHKAKKWQAQIMRNRKAIYLGLFSKKSDAVAAVKKAL